MLRFFSLFLVLFIIVDSNAQSSSGRYINGKKCGVFEEKSPYISLPDSLANNSNVRYEVYYLNQTPLVAAAILDQQFIAWEDLSFKSPKVMANFDSIISNTEDFESIELLLGFDKIIDFYFDSTVQLKHMYLHNSPEYIDFYGHGG